MTTELWNEDGWKLKYSEKQLCQCQCQCHFVHLTLNDLGSNTDLRGVRPATDRLSRGMALMVCDPATGC